MSDQGEEKTEQPTSKKIKDAREEGKVAQSTELTMSVALICLISTLVAGYQGKLSLYFNNFFSITELIKNNELSLDMIVGALKNSLDIAERFLLLPILLAAIISFFVNVAQLKGLIISKEAFKFDFKKLDPVENFKSTFSKKKFIKLLRQFIEIGIMFIVAYIICSRAVEDILKIYLLNIREISFYIAILLFKIFITLFVIHVLFAVTDYILEQRSLIKQLMMSLHDIKEEYKETEGNPEIKQERKRLHYELFQEGGHISENVSDSSILIANPTHIAVIVAYMPDKAALPFVLAKEKGVEAVNLIEMAQNSGMIIERDIHLARALFEIADVGSVVPQSLLNDVADLFGKNLPRMPKLYAKFTQVVNPVKQSARNQGKV